MLFIYPGDEGREAVIPSAVYMTQMDSILHFQCNVVFTRNIIIRIDIEKRIWSILLNWLVIQRKPLRLDKGDLRFI